MDGTQQRTVQTARSIGSANLTGAGMGMKSPRKRNFEAGILTDDPEMVEAAIVMNLSILNLLIHVLQVSFFNMMYTHRTTHLRTQILHKYEPDSVLRFFGL